MARSRGSAKFRNKLMAVRTAVAGCRRQLFYVRTIGIGLTLLWGVVILTFFLLVSHLTSDAAVDDRWFLLLWLVGMGWLALGYSRFYQREKRLQEKAEREVSLASMAHEEKGFLMSVLDAIRQSTVVIRPDYSLVLLNREARKQLRPQRLAAAGMPKCHKLRYHLDQPCTGPDHPCPLARVMLTGKAEHVVHRHHKSGGSVVFVELEVSPVFGENGRFAGIVESERDITSLVLKNKEHRDKVLTLKRRADSDPLTKLPNWALLKDRLFQALLRASRSKKHVAVLFLDLDNFKQINDSHGHEAGDTVLAAVANRIQRCVRKSDTVARYAGDEFIIVLDRVDAISSPGAVARKVLNMLSELIHLERDTVCVTGSIGISLYPLDGHEVDTLLRCADSALYQAKRSGGNLVQYFHQMQPISEKVTVLNPGKSAHIRR